MVPDIELNVLIKYTEPMCSALIFGAVFILLCYGSQLFISQVC